MLQGLKQLLAAIILSAGCLVSAQASDLSEESELDLLPATISPTELPDKALDEVSKADSHYTIDEAANLVPVKQPEHFSNPMSNLSLSMSGAVNALASAKPVVLTRWIKHAGAPATPREKYQRLKHYGRWINDPNDETCYDTRAQVLIRDSKKEVTFRGAKNCRVATGQWKDPYAGKTLTDARDIQIDHFVPLKNSYVSGGWKWEPVKRCLYANYMSNDYHLISVYGPENMSKGDRTPADYLPSNTGFTCDYLQRWLKVKLTWNLTMTSLEAKAIRDEFQKYNCDINLMKMTRKELDTQRKAILKNLPVCERKTRSRPQVTL